jgi:hypothetical protein
MNWKRGLIRLWLLVSIAWSGFAVSEGWRDAAEDCANAQYYASKLHPECSEYRRLLDGEEACKQHRQALTSLTPGAQAAVIAAQKTIADDGCRMGAMAWAAAEDAAPQVALFIVASIAIFIIGAALLWVVRGFRREEAKA